MWWRMSLLMVGIGGTCIGQISPGPLARAHQELEGVTQCTMCHNFGFGQRDFKCLDCHTEIQARLDAGKGYHARQFDPSRGQLDCVRCHSDHHGPEFVLTRFDTSTFRHVNNTGFPLRGAHAEAACSACHTAQFVQPALRGSIKVSDLNRTYLGLGTQCATCHEDPHAGQLGAECTTCHSEVAWNPAPSFNHDTTRYPLLGPHRQARCEGCHRPAPGSDTLRYRGLKFATCDNCHRDPHQGAFDTTLFTNSDGTCTSCHLVTSWNLLRGETGFDHSRTDFPLRGKHAETGCSGCHMGTNFSEPIQFAACTNCHEDVHHGQFDSREGGGECSNCHNEDAFVPSLFTRETHQQSAFALQGVHASLECATCHAPAGPDANYKLGTTTCVGCHMDPHRGEFASDPAKDECETCHTQEEFHPSTFQISRHKETDFPLTGAHLAVVCSDCHGSLPATSIGPITAKVGKGFGAEVLANAARTYHFADQSCAGCHADPHRLPAESLVTCETCHTTDQWSALRPFDHEQTEFSLQGSHEQARCVACHLPRMNATASNVVSTANFSNTPTQCFQCHEDIHGGQFMSPGKEEDCATCHSITTWSTGTFDHQTTRFPLDGAHKGVGCALCHDQFVPVEGRQVRLYRGAPTKCEACHAGGVAELQ